ncbi:hypothetical protein R6Q57_014250, partial [Mikania cordata]
APHWLTYDFPPQFTGKDEEINLFGDGTEKPEFGEWSWMSPEQVVDRVCPLPLPPLFHFTEVAKWA